MNAVLKPLDQPRRELLLGCGSNRVKQVYPKDEPREWQGLVTLDIDPSHRPDVVHDLNILPVAVRGQRIR